MNEINEISLIHPDVCLFCPARTSSPPATVTPAQGDDCQIDRAKSKKVTSSF